MTWRACPSLLLLLLVSALSSVSAQNSPYDEVHDTCNSLTTYMTARKQSYSQHYAAVPEEPLRWCGSGPSCCSASTEDVFKSELATYIEKINFDRTRDINVLQDTKDKIATYITEVLTRAHRVNNRTAAVVRNYMDVSNVQSVDKMEIPKAVLLDVAESNGIVGLRSENSQCVGQMLNYLRTLGKLQLDGLYIARLLYNSMEPAIEVLSRMPGQNISDECMDRFLKVTRCGICLDSTSKARTCQSTCSSVATPCFSHIAAAGSNWEEYARLTGLTLDALDKFIKVYSSSMAYTIRQMKRQLLDTDIADMCGFDVATNLANGLERNRRNSEDVPSVRTTLLDPSFMVGLFRDMDEVHCKRISTINDRCWNGESIGVNSGTGGVTGEGIVNEESITENLRIGLEQLAAFNSDYREVETLKLDSIDNSLDRYNVITETPALVIGPGNSAAHSLCFSALIVPLLSLLY